ncbi:MAG: hypothetical protein KGJ98_07890 [Chloroflexota bacterium]|nr:hypothetical protein [Chloroflexota bacterium]
MKTSGLPCRASHDCDEVFSLASQDSMDALRDAAERRDRHELEAHGYRHVPTAQTTATPFSQSLPARRGRRGKRRDGELNVV